MQTNTKVVYTIFAGRRENLEVQFKYLNDLIDNGSISEVHLWDYTREISDSIWLKTVLKSQQPYIYRAPKRDYRILPLKTDLGAPEFNKLRLRIKASHDAHILLFKNQASQYEILLGGWDNSRNVIRNSTGIQCQHDGPLFHGGQWCDVDIVVKNNVIKVIVDGKTIMESLCAAGNYKVCLAGHHTCSVQYDLEPCKDMLGLKPTSLILNEKFKLMQAVNKWTWVDYYAHYNKNTYPNHVIIKADDDIVYIDTNGFNQFIQNRLANPDWLISFASTINNGVCAYYQQKMGLIPETIGNFPYDTFQGELWSNSKLCENLHNFFINNITSFTNKSKTLPPIPHPIGDRISINFFAVMSNDLHIFQDLLLYTTNHLDDEHHITVTIPLKYGRRLVVDQSLVVAHLSFFKQIDDGLSSQTVLDRYRQLTQ